MNECKDNVKDVAQVADLIAASSNGVAGIFAYFIGQTLPDSYSLAYMGPGALAQLGGDAICQHVPMLDHILNRLNGISKVSSPLILDLDGNGVETTIIGDGAYFDFESDGHSEATAWVGSDDALLVRDLNNDGRIDVGSELFGADTYLSNGMRAANGFQALADLDTNFDGIVDQFDEQFATLKLWKDENGNGISESTELYELAELGVSSLNVEYQVSNYVDSNGNQHKQLGTYTSTDGNSYSMTDVWFKTNTIYAVARDYLEVSPQIDDLPDLRGYGHVYSLHQAMVRDSTGRIQEFLNQYMVATTMLERRQALESLVHSWADVDAVNVGSRGTYINARDLAALEKFFDFDFIQDSGINAGTKKPGPNTAAILKDVYSNLLDIFEARLLAQTHLKDLYENLKFQFNESSNILHIDISGVLDYIDQKLAEDNPNGLIVLRDFSFSMRVLGDVETSQTLAILREHYSAQGLLYLAIVDGASLIEGGDTISFGNGTTVVDAGEGDNSISGGNGNHTVITGSGNDTISLGAGMQTVQAGEGDNMVKLSGAGSREVTTGSGDDMVRLYDLAGSHVTLNLGDGDNVVTNGYYSSSSSSPYKDYNGNANIIVTTGGGNDNLVLGHGNHTVYTSDGDDIISLGNGNTLIDVGEGNNSVSGGNGNHTVTTGQGNNAISFSNGNHAVVTGAGNDTISLGAGTQTVQAGEGDNTVKLSGTGSREVTTGSGADTVRLYDLAGSAITLNLGDGDNVVTNGYYSSSSSTPYKDFNGSANITIATGSGNDNLAFYTGSHVIDTGGGNDVISFGNGNTLVDAGEGHNSISGGVGNHSILTGAGNDTISLGAGTQTVQAGEGDNTVSLSGVGQRQVDTGAGADMIRLYDLAGSHVTLNLGDGDNVVTNGYYSSSSSTPYKDFNGNANIMVMTGNGNDTLALYAGNHVINSGDGNDTISFGNGLTIVDAGEGNNSISGGAGNHSVLTGVGNDSIWLGSGTQTVQAGEGDNTIKFSGIGSREVITGSGADTLRLYDLAGSNVTLNLGDGDNVVTNGYYSSSSSTPYKDFNGNANITVITGTGNDSLALYAGNHVISSGDGNDTISFGNGLTVVDAGEGNNSISGGVGNHSILTGAGNDTISLGAGTQTVQAGEGDNTIKFSGAGVREVTTGTGADTVRLYDLAGSTITLSLGDGDNVVTNGYYSSSSSMPYKDFNGNANITVTTGSGNDNLVLGNGSHIVNTHDGDDTVSFGNGNTLIDVGEGNNSVSGGNGNHVVTTGQGNSNISLGSGNHSVLTGAGNDTISLGAGTQTVQAGEGDNTVRLSGAGVREVTTGTGADAVRLYDLAGSNVTLNLGDGDNVVTNGYYSSSSSTPYKDFNGNANITVITGTGNDSLALYAGNHVISSGDGNDTISFGNGTTVVDTGEGNNSISGGNGNHSVLTGAGNDTISLGAGTQTVQAGEGDNTIKLSGAGVREVTTGTGADTVRLYDLAGSTITLSLGDGDNVVTNGYYSSSSSTPYKDFNGNANIMVMTGNGNDTLALYAGNHVINSGDGNDTISFGNGLTILQSGYGEDVVTGAAGNQLFDLGAGNDTATGGAGSSLFIGGAGNDTITTGTGYDILAFNNGDGQDIVNASTGTDNTLSLGGGIHYNDLQFSKSGNNLVLSAGGTDQITLKDWYVGTSNKSIASLQVIAEAMAGFDANGTDTLLDNKVETFDFIGLVNAFDQVRAADASLTSWALSDALLDFHLSGSDTEAIGGDLAYQYGLNGNLTGMGLLAAQATLGNAQFGQGAQTLNAPSAWQNEAVKLA